MSVQLVDPARASVSARTLLDEIGLAFGRTPNAVLALANSPAALAAWWSFETALRGSSVPVGIREQIAVLVAASNDCDYCGRAHAAAARAASVSPEDVLAAVHATASDPEAQAALRFAAAALRDRGDVSASELSAARESGLSDAYLLEILAVIAINTFNNLYVRFCKPALDFGPGRRA
jgi:uncharacterized peroxidase-related enzyme